eukprot:1306274-Rhodomonas_salina.1
MSGSDRPHAATRLSQFLLPLSFPIMTSAWVLSDAFSCAMSRTDTRHVATRWYCGWRARMVSVLFLFGIRRQKQGHHVLVTDARDGFGSGGGGRRRREGARRGGSRGGGGGGEDLSGSYLRGVSVHVECPPPLLFPSPSSLRSTSTSTVGKQESWEQGGREAGRAGWMEG